MKKCPFSGCRIDIYIKILRKINHNLTNFLNKRSLLFSFWEVGSYGEKKKREGERETGEEGDINLLRRLTTWSKNLLQ